jgi:DDE superfamily endonuclease
VAGGDGPLRRGGVRRRAGDPGATAQGMGQPEGRVRRQASRPHRSGAIGEHHPIHGDLLWCDGGWPGSCHEHELIELSGLGEVLDATGVGGLLDRGFRGMASTREHWHAPVGDRRTKDRLTDGQRAYNRCQAGLRAPVEQSIGHLANACGACCTGSGTSSGPLAHSSAWAGGSTGYPREEASRTLSLPSASTKPSARQGTVATSGCAPLVPAASQDAAAADSRHAATSYRPWRDVRFSSRGVRFDPALRWPARRAGSTVALSAQFLRSGMRVTFGVPWS